MNRSSRSRRYYNQPPQRSNSENVFPESWKAFYITEGLSVGRGAAGKVFRVRPRSRDLENEASLHQRKWSTPDVGFSIGTADGYFGAYFEIINPSYTSNVLALKLIRRYRCGRDSITKIRNEIAIMRKLQIVKKSGSRDVSINNQTGIVPPPSACPLLISIHEDPVEVAIVMEYAVGGSLYDVCVSKYGFPFMPTTTATNSAGNGTSERFPILQSSSVFTNCLPEDYILGVLEKVLDALSFMHDSAKIVHLDIKAENILLREHYPSTDIFITDFGLATELDGLKPHKELAGTADYVAPEVINYDPVSFATDMWSVGVLAYFLLTGVSPFLSDSKALTLDNITRATVNYPCSLFERVSPLAVDFIRHLLQRRPGLRPSAKACLNHAWMKRRNNSGESYRHRDKSVKHRQQLHVSQQQGVTNEFVEIELMPDDCPAQNVATTCPMIFFQAPALIEESTTSQKACWSRSDLPKRKRSAAASESDILKHISNVGSSREIVHIGCAAIRRKIDSSIFSFPSKYLLAEIYGTSDIEVIFRNRNTFTTYLSLFECNGVRKLSLLKSVHCKPFRSLLDISRSESDKVVTRGLCRPILGSSTSVLSTTPPEDLLLSSPQESEQTGSESTH